LLNHYDNKAVAIELDSYYKDFQNLTFKEREKINFDHPNSFDIELLKEHLTLLKSGEKIKKPIYNFKTHKRQANTNVINPNTLIFLEGTLIFHFIELINIINLKIFIETNESVRYQRRIDRDIKQRGRAISNVKKQYQNTVKPMHEKYIDPLKSVADVIISGELDIVDSANRIIKKIDLLRKQNYYNASKTN
jgi:uridine kinase